MRKYLTIFEKLLLVLLSNESRSDNSQAVLKSALIDEWVDAEDFCRNGNVDHTLADNMTEKYFSSLKAKCFSKHKNFITT